MNNPITYESASIAAREYVDATARLFGVDAPHRAPLWAERVNISLPDIASLRDFTCSHDAEPLGLPAAVATRAPSGALPAGHLVDLVKAVSEGVVDPVNRVRAALAAMGAHATLNAMRSIDAHYALAQAAELRERVRNGQPLGRLAGVMVAVKDCFLVAGQPATFGTRSIPVARPVESSLCVARLQQEDAIVVGMTTMHELAYGATSDNPHVGRVKHPIDPDRLPGGSSGGSAVAVACGMADVALGTDTAGSVRMPAALCGLTGFKPTYGLVSTKGVLPLAWSLDHVGTFGHAAADHALLIEAMAGLPAGSLVEAPPAKIRACSITNYFLDAVDPEVWRIYEGALQRLARAGVEIINTTVDAVRQAPMLQHFTIVAEAAQIHSDRALCQPDGLGEEVRIRLESGQFIRAVDYIKAQRLRSVLLDALIEPLERGADVLITPTVLVPAPLPGATVSMGGKSWPIHPTLTRCTLPFNLTGMPAISLPCGTTQEGLPVGLQIAAARGADARLLAVATRLESLLRL